MKTNRMTINCGFTERDTNDSKILMRNLGFGEGLLQMLEREEPVYALQKEKIRKVFSDGAVKKIGFQGSMMRKTREEEDVEAYRDIYTEEDSGPFQEDERADFFIEDSEPKEIPDKEECANLSLFQNCSQSQITKLNRLVSEFTSPQDKVLVKAYRSKLKSKFYQIYEVNSKQFQEKIKYKIFHKCSFPSCGRTFASAGWLKSHFNEHLHELKKNKFNILFENFLVNYKKYFN